jgi:hypothetical protein
MLGKAEMQQNKGNLQKDVNGTKLAVAVDFSRDCSEDLLGPGNIASESVRREGVEFIWTDRL